LNVGGVAHPFPLVDLLGPSGTVAKVLGVHAPFDPVMVLLAPLEVLPTRASVNVFSPLEVLQDPSWPFATLTC